MSHVLLKKKELSVAVLIAISSANSSAEVVIKGDNGYLSGICDTTLSIPSSCSTIAIDKLDDRQTSSDLKVATSANTGIAIGTNLSLNNEYTESSKTGSIEINKGNK